MTRHYNRRRERKKRKELRNNPTDAEKILWQYLKGRQILGFKFRRQYSIDGFVVDFYCTKVKLAIELDGDSHFSSNEAIEYDLDREHHIKKYGIRFLRFKDEEVFENIDAVVNSIEEKLKGLSEE